MTESRYDPTYCEGEVRAHDADRHLVTQFAPAPRRAALYALYAFNLEVAKTAEVVSEELLGQIRLEWWREAIGECYGGEPRRHPVVEPLAAAIREHGLTQGHFERLIEARAFDLDPEPHATQAAFEDYAEATSATLVWLALDALGSTGEGPRQAGRHIGIAWALTGLIRAMPFHLRAGRIYVPLELSRRHGIRRSDLLALKASPGLAAAIREIADAARSYLASARAVSAEVGRDAAAALLLATLADGYLERLARVGHDPFDPRLAVPSALRSLRLWFRATLGRY